VYASRGQRQVSWYEPDPRLSAALVTDAAASLPAGRDSAVIDAGGGASLLAQRLTSAGFTDVTVLDVSAAALAADRAAYLATMRAALPGGGGVILAAFAADGPEYCSGLPVARYDPAGLAAELTAAYGDAVTITGHHAEQHRTPAGAVQPFTWLTARLS